jgi:hypothetical protein
MKHFHIALAVILTLTAVSCTGQESARINIHAMHNEQALNR